MDDIEKRLVACFSAVLTGLRPEEITQASSSSLEIWDSLATVNLLALVEEEFGVTVDDEDSIRFDSFKNILAYLQRAMRK